MTHETRNTGDDPPSLPPRPADGHKGTFGTAAVVGGSASGGGAMLGAPVLSARAALRSGVGLARLVVPAPLVVPAIGLLPEATGVGLPVGPDGGVIAHEAAAVLDRVLGDADAVAAGPGLGAAAGARAMVLRLAGQDETPVVLDADGLNLLAGVPSFELEIRAPLVLTPHPGEFTRLAGPLRVGESPTDPATRPAAAEALAQRLGCVVVLKGAGTVVSDGQRTWVCPRGHHALGTAGTGDVLTGLIAGLIARLAAKGPRAIGGLELPRPADRPLDLFDAARVGVLAHAAAGEAWAARHGGAAAAGLLAGELADELPGVLAGLTAARGG